MYDYSNLCNEVERIHLKKKKSFLGVFVENDNHIYETYSFIHYILYLVSLFYSFVTYLWMPKKRLVRAFFDFSHIGFLVT